MLKRLFYPLRTNVFIFLLSFFALVPFCFLLIAQNAVEYGYSIEYQNVDKKCLFDYRLDRIESFSELDDTINQRTNEIESLSKKDYLYSDSIILGNTYVIDNNGIRMFGQVRISKSKEALKQYENIIMGFKLDLQDNASFFVSSEYANDHNMNIGQELTLQNYNDNEKIESFVIDGVYDAPSSHQTDFFIVTDSLDSNINNIITDIHLCLVHHYKTNVPSNIVNEGRAKLGLALTCKAFEIETRTSGFNVVFKEGRFITALVSIAIAVVMLYAFNAKEQKLYQSEIIQKHFYEKKTKTFLCHFFSDLLLSLLSCILCFLVILISKMTLKINDFSFEIDYLIYLLFAAQLLLIAIESTFNYFLWHNLASKKVT